MDLLDRLRLDVPVAQAGMGGGIAGARLAAAVADAGGLGTIGLAAPAELRTAIDQVRDVAPSRAVAVNLLMPFVHRRHIDTCIDRRIDVAVVAFGGDAAFVRQLRDSGIFVLVMVGTEEQARTAVAWGADGLIAQGAEAGGHLAGTTPALEFLPRATAIADDRPVLLAGGIATAADTAAALAVGAAGVVAGTRFLLTDESGAHREYQQRVLAARKTLETTLFGLTWPSRHRVVPNAATQRWCREDGTPRRIPALINAWSSPLARLAPDGSEGVVLRMQRPTLPLFSPMAPREGMPFSWVERSALYAGESALRIERLIPAKQAVADLSPGTNH